MTHAYDVVSYTHFACAAGFGRGAVFGQPAGGLGPLSRPGAPGDLWHYLPQICGTKIVSGLHCINVFAVLTISAHMFILPPSSAKCCNVSYIMQYGGPLPCHIQMLIIGPPGPTSGAAGPPGFAAASAMHPNAAPPGPGAFRSPGAAVPGIIACSFGVMHRMPQ